MKVRVYGIFWDFDKGEPSKPQGNKKLKKRGLKSSYILDFGANEAETIEELAENGRVADKLSDKTGYCVFGLSYELVSE